MSTLSESCYEVQLEVFAGPLDLLLHLIRQQEIDIYDIPIASITDQYLSYLEMMRDLNITLAGDFILMAATLILIKSRMLLPAPPPDSAGTEEEDPRQELVQQLLEHERFKKAAALLHDRQVYEACVFPRGMDEFEEEEKEAILANVYDLVQAFHSIVERYKEQVVLEVEHESVSLEEKLDDLRALLKLQRRFFFSMFLRERISKLHLVMTFVALLEMAKQGEILMLQKKTFGDILVKAC